MTDMRRYGIVYIKPTDIHFHAYCEGEKEGGRKEGRKEGRTQASKRRGELDSDINLEMCLVIERRVFGVDTQGRVDQGI